MKIEIITTTAKSIKETGFGSHRACEDFRDSLLGHYPDIVLTACHQLSDLQEVVYRKPHIVVLADKHIYDRNGEKIWLSDFFERANINYTGSNQHAMKYDFDKISAKKAIASSGIPTASFFTAMPNEFKSEAELPLSFPLFLKPNSAANSGGIDSDSLVYDFDSFKSKISSLYHKYQCPVLVETYLPGREFTVAVVEKCKVFSTYVLEIVAPEEEGSRILGRKVKRDDTEQLSTVTNPLLAFRLSNMAKNCFRSLGARDYGRIDIKMDDNGRCYFIEANLTPGLKNGISYFPVSCQMNANLSHIEIVNLIMQGAVNRVAVSQPAPGIANPYLSRIE